MVMLEQRANAWPLVTGTGWLPSHLILAVLMSHSLEPMRPLADAQTAVGAGDERDDQGGHPNVDRLPNSSNTVFFLPLTSPRLHQTPGTVAKSSLA